MRQIASVRFERGKMFTSNSLIEEAKNKHAISIQDCELYTTEHLTHRAMTVFRFPARTSRPF